ncbi:Hypothetical protein, putative [Bodo saltans]|uniref:C3H1-type domain-containing protein n=1 Tax=Bodo saltans TaxID=75058 RepID=A0A0S4J4B2_BODSA|nr:Hypothetical protein, putative [Bodo saltans]|eukprot:CUG75529.1 Hypothetical protein, putative [Bodo saltans]
MVPSPTQWIEGGDHQQHYHPANQQSPATTTTTSTHSSLSAMFAPPITASSQLQSQHRRSDGGEFTASPAQIPSTPPSLLMLPTQLPPHQRNKAVVCKLFIEGRCTTLRDECPYLHAFLDELRVVPERACRYFMQGACLRGTCPFYHGSQSELKALIRTHGASGRYTLRDLNLAVLEPPASSALQHPALIPGGGSSTTLAHVPQPVASPLMVMPTMLLSPPAQLHNHHYPQPYLADSSIPLISTTDLSQFPHPTTSSQQQERAFLPFGMSSGGDGSSSAQNDSNDVAGGIQPAATAPSTSPPSATVTNTNLLHLQQQYAYYGKNATRSPQQASLSRQGSSLSRASSNLSAVSTGTRHQNNNNSNLEGSLSLQEGEGGASLTSLFRAFPLNLSGGAEQSGSMTPFVAPAGSATGGSNRGENSTLTPTPSLHLHGSGGSGFMGGGYHFLQPPTMMLSPASSTSSAMLLHHHHPSSGNYNAVSSASSFVGGGASQGNNNPNNGFGAGRGGGSPFLLQQQMQPMLSVSPIQPATSMTMLPCFVVPGGGHSSSGIFDGSSSSVEKSGLTALQLQQHQQLFFPPAPTSSSPALFSVPVATAATTTTTQSAAQPNGQPFLSTSSEQQRMVFAQQLQHQQQQQPQPSGYLWLGQQNQQQQHQINCHHDPAATMPFFAVQHNSYHHQQQEQQQQLFSTVSPQRPLSSAATPSPARANESATAAGDAKVVGARDVGGTWL